MAMSKLNRCPFCGGFMVLHANPDSYYAECLQCSHRRALEIMAEFEGGITRMEQEPDLGE